MNFKSKLVSLFAGLLVLAVLGGCATESHTQIRKDAEEKSGAIDKSFQVQQVKRSSASDSSGVWVNKRSVTIHETVLPAIFRQPLKMRFDISMTLSKVVYALSRETGLRFTLAVETRQDAQNNIAFGGYASDGSLKQTLDELTAMANMSWRYREGAVEIYRIDTKVFEISAAPGNTEFIYSSTNKAAQSNASSTSSSGAVGGATTGSGQDYKTTVNLDFWGGVSRDLKNLLTPAGRFSISEAGSTITVTDAQEGLAAVETYVRDMNAKRARQVAIAVGVYSVETTNGNDYGVDWTAVYNNVSRGVSLQLLSNQVTPSGAGTIGAIIGANSSSPWAGTKALFSALSKEGRATVVTEISRIVMNGEAIPINNLREISYLAEITTNSVPNAGTTNSLKPGMVTEGFSMTMAPQILAGDTVNMMAALDFAFVDKFSLETSGGQTIRTPERSTRSFLEKFSVKSGETYVFGFRQNQNAANDAGFGGTGVLATLAGGSRNSNASNKTIVVTITPTILNAAR